MMSTNKKPKGMSFEEFINNKQQRLEERKKQFNLDSKLKYDKTLDDINNEISNVNELINELKNETLNADKKISDIIDNNKKKWKKYGTDIKTQLKSFFQHKFDQLNVKNDKLIELKNKIKSNNVITDDLETEFENLKNDINISTDIFVNFDSHYVDKSLNSIEISDKKIKYKSNDNAIEILKDENKKLKAKLNEQLQIAQIFKNNNLEALNAKIIELKTELDASKDTNARMEQDFKERETQLQSKVKQSEVKLEDNTQKMNNQMNTEITAKSNELDKLQQLCNDQSNKIRNLEDELKQTKKQLNDSQNGMVLKDKIRGTIEGELYKFKGDSLKSLKENWTPKHKKYCVYSPQLKLLIYADNKMEYYKNNRRYTNIYGFGNTSNVIESKLPDAFKKKWFKLDGNENGTDRIIVFGCDTINETNNWCDKIKASLTKIIQN